MNHWDREYQHPQFMTGAQKPQAFVLRTLRTLKKQHHFRLADATVLDLGCGTGRSVVYMAQQGAQVWGCDVSREAIMQAKDAVKYVMQNESAQNGDEAILIREPQLYVQDLNVDSLLPQASTSVDLVMSVMVLHLLSKEAREKLISEVARVLQSGKFFCFRTFALEGDKNAKRLIEEYPAHEENSYRFPGTGHVEHLFTQSELRALLRRHNLTEIMFKKQTGYQRMNDRVFRRCYWEVIAQKDNRDHS